MGKDISLFFLSVMKDEYDNMADVVSEMFEEMNISEDSEVEFVVLFFNYEQSYVYDVMLLSVENISGGVFFVDGSGGTGKMFLYKVLLVTVRRSGKMVIVTATSGVAVFIMSGGSIVYLSFKILLNMKEGDVCSFIKQSGTVKMLRSLLLILWDEVTMIKRQVIEVFDKSMSDMMDSFDLFFGGKTVVFGGDFSQVFPVVRKGMSV